MTQSATPNSGWRSRWQFAIVFALSVLMFAGCVVYDDQHMQVENLGPNKRLVQVGGMVTDQLIQLWEVNQLDSGDTMQTLRDLTEHVPIVFAESKSFVDFPIEAGDIWHEAIADHQLESFSAAFENVRSNISDRTLVLHIEYVPYGADELIVEWGWQPRDFIGKQLVHSDDQRTLSPIGVSDNGKKLIHLNDGLAFVPWGSNYDHDRDGRLLDEYWIDDWKTVVQDFEEMVKLGNNCVRIHLQYGMFMNSPTEPNLDALAQLRDLVSVAESLGLYLDITGLACYHRQNIPDWYNDLDESEHWDQQAAFWAAIARTVAGSPAVFCYDLMNEPVIGSNAQDDPDYPWLVNSALGDSYFVQRIALELNGRTRKQIAAAWIDKMVGTIRQHDPDTLVTLGVIPWAIHNYPNGSPLFYDPAVSQNLDFACIHIHPDSLQSNPSEIEDILNGMIAYSTLGMPLVIEEISGYRSGNKVMEEVLTGSLDQAEGWIGFYWGQTIEEYEERDDLIGAILADYLKIWKRLGPDMQRKAAEF